MVRRPTDIRRGEVEPDCPVGKQPFGGTRIRPESSWRPPDQCSCSLQNAGLACRIRPEQYDEAIGGQMLPAYSPELLRDVKPEDPHFAPSVARAARPDR